MPRKEITYYCDVCGKAYYNEKEALECEGKHLLPEKVNSPEYLQDDRKNIYPYSVLVHFKGGKTSRYYRKENY